MMNCPHCNTHVDEHAASRCLDAWVAEIVMDANIRLAPPGRFGTFEFARDDPDNGIYYSPVPYCSSSIAAAWEVVEKLRNSGDICCLRFFSDYNYTWDVRWCFSELSDKNDGHKEHSLEKSLGYSTEEFPLAICRAAIKAVQTQSPPHDRD